MSKNELQKRIREKCELKVYSLCVCSWLDFWVDKWEVLWFFPSEKKDFFLHWSFQRPMGPTQFLSSGHGGAFYPPLYTGHCVSLFRNLQNNFEFKNNSNPPSPLMAFWRATLLWLFCIAQRVLIRHVGIRTRWLLFDYWHEFNTLHSCRVEVCLVTYSPLNNSCFQRGEVLEAWKCEKLR